MAETAAGGHPFAPVIRRAVRVTDVAAATDTPRGSNLTLAGRDDRGMPCALVLRVAGHPDEYERLVGEVYELRLTPVGGEGT